MSKPAMLFFLPNIIFLLLISETLSCHEKVFLCSHPKFAGFVFCEDAGATQ
jgi:hypothetical protein